MKNPPLPPAPPSVKDSKYIQRVLLEIRDGIDIARANGVKCEYPDRVEFEIDGAKFSVRFPFQQPRY